MSGDLYAVTLEDMIGEIERELNQRRQVYSRMVYSGQMNKKTADRRYEVMTAVLNKLKGEHDERRRKHAVGTD